MLAQILGLSFWIGLIGQLHERLIFGHCHLRVSCQGRRVLALGVTRLLILSRIATLGLQALATLKALLVDLVDEISEIWARSLQTSQVNGFPDKEELGQVFVLLRLKQQKVLTDVADLSLVLSIYLIVFLVDIALQLLHYGSQV